MANTIDYAQVDVYLHKTETHLFVYRDFFYNKDGTPNVNVKHDSLKDCFPYLTFGGLNEDKKTFLICKKCKAKVPENLINNL